MRLSMCSVLVFVDWEIRWSAGGCRECISRRGGGEMHFAAHVGFQKAHKAHLPCAMAWEAPCPSAHV